jgi:hypothetical protein
MGKLSDLMIEFCEIKEKSGCDFDATMADVIRGGNPTTDEFCAWHSTTHPAPPTPERPAHLRSEADNQLIALAEKMRTDRLRKEASDIMLKAARGISKKAAIRRAFGHR